MRGDLLYDRLGDLAGLDDRLRRGDPVAHDQVVRVLRSLTAEQLSSEDRAVRSLVRWLTAAERHQLAARDDVVDLRPTTTAEPNRRGSPAGAEPAMFARI